MNRVIVRDQRFTVNSLESKLESGEVVVIILKLSKI